MRHLLLILGIICATILNAGAQQEPCALDEINHIQRQQNPNFDQELHQLDDQIQQYLGQNNGAGSARGGVRTISVAVHVVYNTSAENVSTTSINNMMNTLNADFRKLNSDFSSVRSQFQAVAGDAQIEFCLDTIVRRNTSVTCWNYSSNPNGMKSNASGGSSPLNSRFWLNIWIVDICGNTGGGVAGYAYLPTQGMHGSSIDGLVIDYQLGYNNGFGRTATHEIGHYLGLLHPWGSGSGSCSADDGFADTPNTDGPTYSCFGSETSCGVTTQVENFMDYSPCELMFTQEQSNYMNAVLDQIRGSLFTSPGCNSSGGATPTAAFTADRTTVCVGETINFSDNSTGSPTAWAWTFTGGSPGSSTAQNPTVTYNSPGTYTVTLAATNANGTDTETKTGYITVTNSQSLPLVEGFEGSFVPTGWELVNPDGANTWARTTSASGYGASNACIVMDNWTYNGGQGQQDLLLTPVYDFTSVNNAVLTYDWAYAEYTGAPSPDSLFIIVSPDCGENFFLLSANGSSGMATTSPVNNAAFVPTASQWDSDTIDLASLAGFSNVQFGFLAISEYGQNIYLDNINISTPVVNAPPVADFAGSPTVISVGGTVNFNDLSTNAPTSWNWTFAGGTPGSSTAQNPTGIQYNNPGTYAVTLTATNSFGSDTETKTAYIEVVTGGSGACAYETNLLQSSVSAFYSLGAGNGYLSGHNARGDIAKAEQFTGILPASTVDTVSIAFALAKFASGASTVDITIWDANGAGGAPGTELGSQTIPINQITAAQFNDFVFTPAIQVNGNFYAGVEFTYASGDTIVIFTDTLDNVNASGSTAWEQLPNNAWVNYNNANSWDVDTRHWILAHVCEPSTSNPPVADFTASTTTVCQGGTVAFTNTTTNGNTYSWTFAGGTPGSSAAQNPTVTYNTAGTYAVTLVASNSDGSDTETKSGFITVQAAPTASTTSINLSCNGAANGAVNLSVSGGTTPYTYSWTNNATTQNISGLAAGSYTVTVTDANGCTSAANAQVTQPTAINTNTSTTPATCGGATGSATVSASGGTPPYTYLWNNNETSATISNLLPAVYTVVVTDDNGCTATGVAIVGGSSQVNATLNATNATCAANDGAITASANGGVGPYVYNWSNNQSGATITGLTPGSYTVTVLDANNCSTTATTSITAPAGITLTFTSNDASCGSADGSATVSAIGGSGNYTYTWSNNGNGATIANVAAGSYAVTVSDGSCTVTGTTSVNNLGGPSISISSSTNVSCFGGNNGSASAIATGGALPYSYNWSSGSGTASATNLTAGTYTVTVTDGASCIATTIVTITQPAELTLNQSSVTNVSCFGGSDGSASVSANGGTTPYTYSWGGATNTALAAGSYPVTVTDGNGCTASTTVTVSEPAQMTIALSNTNPGCASSNGQVLAAVTGGVTPYTYSWNNNTSANPATGLSAGAYAVTVTDNNGCTVTANTNLNAASGPTLSTSSTPVSCGATNDGTATVTASGGNTPYAFTWQDADGNSAGSTATVTGLTSGAYSVTVSDANNCDATATVVVSSVGPQLNASVTNVTGCNGNNNGAVVLAVTGGQTPYSYAWNTGASGDNIAGLTAGTYTVTVVDQTNCVTTATYQITEPDLVEANITVTDATTGSAADGSAVVNPTGGTAPYTVAWSTGETGTGIQNLGAGSYSVAVTDANNCVVTENFTVGAGVGITMVDMDPVINIYPNPNEGRFVVDIVLQRTGDVSLEIYNTIGKQVFVEKVYQVKETSIAVDLSELPPAAYYVKFTSGEHNAVSKVLKLNQ